MKILKRTLAAAMLAMLALAPAASGLYDEDAPERTPYGDELSITNISAPTVTPISVVPAWTSLPDNVLVFGTIAEILDGSLRIVNPDENAAIPEIVVHIGEQTRVIDSVSGDPAGAEALAEGEFVYVYVNSFMTMSLPPQAGAQLILCGVPQDFLAPTYHTVKTAEMSEDGASITFTTDKGDEFTFGEDVALTPYLTRNMVYLFNIVPGTRMLIWQGPKAELFRDPEPEMYGGYAPVKAMLFAYGYSGYFAVDGVALSFNGEPVELAGAPILTGEYGETLLPLRAVCEALGWQVDWDAELRAAIVSRGGDAFVVLPGKEIAGLGDAEVLLSITPKIIDGLTMISANDAAYLLNVYFAGK